MYFKTFEIFQSIKKYRLESLCALKYNRKMKYSEVNMSLGLGITIITINDPISTNIFDKSLLSLDKCY